MSGSRYYRISAPGYIIIAILLLASLVMTISILLTTSEPIYIISGFLSITIFSLFFVTSLQLTIYIDDESISVKKTCMKQKTEIKFDEIVSINYDSYALFELYSIISKTRQRIDIGNLVKGHIEILDIITAKATIATIDNSILSKVEEYREKTK